MPAKGAGAPNAKVPTNIYSDSLAIDPRAYGSDISSQRLDSLDRHCLALALELTADRPEGSEQINGIDLGCGLGVPGIMLALLGVRMLLVDCDDLGPRFESLGRALPVDGLRFLRTDIRHLSPAALPGRLDMAYSQRTIHYLRFDEAGRMLATVAAPMPPRSRLFLSASGLLSELGEGYPGRDLPPVDRFAPLAPAMADRHAIHEPVCLYTPRDLCDLVEPVGFRTVDSTTSPFGNVKAVFERI